MHGSFLGAARAVAEGGRIIGLRRGKVRFVKQWLIGGGKPRGQSL